jgi:glycosyltransferase involved in cell wall biosynthesis
MKGKVSGAETSLILLLTYLEDEYDIKVTCPHSNSLAKKLRQLCFNCYCFPVLKSRSYCSLRWLFEWLRTNYSILRIISKARPDIVHANSIYAATISALPAFVMRRKLIWHCRDFSKYKLVSKICSLFCEKIIAVSCTIRDHLIRHGVKTAKIVVIHNGVKIRKNLKFENKKFLLQAKPEYWRQPFVFANIGQFVPWKKQISFLEATIKIANKIPNSEFLLVGEDLFGGNSAYKRELQDKIQHPDIRKITRHLAWQSDMSRVWTDIDCLVHTAEKEPFGRVIIEAMANKIPVIAIDSCGPSEIVQNNVTGILVPPGDINKLCKAMLAIASRPQLAGRLADAAYKHVNLNFAAEKTADSVREVYRKVLGA